MFINHGSHYSLNASKRAVKRVGRGIGSGKGKTSSRGVKGQKARSGVSICSFEGGQNPFYTRMPKRGFVSLTSKKDNYVLSLDVVNYMLASGRLNTDNVLNISNLKSLGVIPAYCKKLRIVSGKLGSKSVLNAKVDFEVSYASPSAIEVIKSAAGTVNIV